MHHRLLRAAVVSAVLFASAARAAPAAAAPTFDVAYRAWEIVTGLARDSGNPAASGECGRTFRPFVIPGLRRQTPQEQDVAATACVEAARAACANARWRKTAEHAANCAEFR